MLVGSERIVGAWWAVLYRIDDDGTVRRIAVSGPHAEVDEAVRAKARHSVPPLEGSRWFHTVEFGEREGPLCSECGEYDALYDRDECYGCWYAAFGPAWEEDQQEATR